MMNIPLRRGSGVYIVRTRKPCARFNIPLLSRHFAYVGETNNFHLRIPQHIVGGGRFRSIPKPWADLDPRVYYVPLPAWKWLMKSVETFFIGLLWPVYNNAKNRWNPRRITPLNANRQRFARDTKTFYPNFTVGHMALCLAAGVVLLLCIGGAL